MFARNSIKSNLDFKEKTTIIGIQAAFICSYLLRKELLIHGC